MKNMNEKRLLPENGKKGANVKTWIPAASKVIEFDESFVVIKPLQSQQKLN